VQNILVRLRREVRATLTRPSRVLDLANPRKFWAHAQWLVSSDPAFDVGDWRSHAAGLNVRTYRSYDDYVRHQRAKLPTLDLTAYDRTFYDHLHERLKAHGLRPGATVLCLGARLGTEVRAFLSHRCFAVGIDLNPGPENRHVLFGDFHALQFADGSVDVVFTNALDHALDIQRMLSEVSRVLKPNGLFLVEAVHGTAEGTSPGFYESFFWATIDDLVTAIEQAQLRFDQRAEFVHPWSGAHLRFRKPEDAHDAGPEARG
jgi:SAM-dependent methyltransferase